jgi:hypothetical protein
MTFSIPLRVKNRLFATIGAALLAYAVYCGVNFGSLMHPAIAANSVLEMGVITLIAGAATLGVGIYRDRTAVHDSSTVLQMMFGGLSIPFGILLVVAAGSSEASGGAMLFFGIGLIIVYSLSVLLAGPELGLRRTAPAH